MKKIKRFSVITILTIYLIYIFSAFMLSYAQIQYDLDGVSENVPSKDSAFDYYDYVIDKYHVNIDVKEDNKLDIEEEIVANFKKPRHGIFRKIPLKNRVIRSDGVTTKNKVKITNVSVDNKFSKKNENGFLKIKIGSPKEKITGEQKYLIKYTYDLKKDPLKDKDELYFNIIGTQWDTAIGNISFTINMPKEFDQSKLGFSSGRFKEIENNNISYYVIGNQIKGRFNGILKPQEGITVRCELEEGYFKVKQYVLNNFDYFLMFLPVIFLIISIYLWSKYGRDDIVVETVEFYPPEEKNSLDIALLYRGRVTTQDVISLLIYLANKGYIKIIEHEKKTGLFKSSTYEIIKLKHYDGNDINEEEFLNKLFESTSGDIGSSVKNSDLENKFYKVIEKILERKNKKENKTIIFEKSASNKSWILRLFIFITYCIILVPPMLKYADIESMFVSLFFQGFGFSIIFATLTGTIITEDNSKIAKIFTTIFGIIWGLLIGIFPWFDGIYPILKEEPLYLNAHILGLVVIFGITLCLKYLPKRTKYGTEMLGKIRGFKHFLEVAEKEELEEMVLKDPEYFYNILPYTYVLGISEKWIKKFENIAIKEPEWYSSSNTFTPIAFGKSMNTAFTSVKSSMISNPNTSSGGGFSGGGSGGGGGGSW